jgi:3-phenylpropionate/trans-cinnamate dioxygenase ferredoxin subunit
MSPTNYYPVCDLDELPEGERLFFDVGRNPIVIFNVGGDYYAIDDKCTHDDGPLGEGDLDDCEITCPRHGARFDIRTGDVLTLPAVMGVKSYPLRVEDGVLQIGVEN